MLDQSEKVIPLTDLARQRGLRPRTLARAAAAGLLPVVVVNKRLYTTAAAAAEFFRPRPLTPAAL